MAQGILVVDGSCESGSGGKALSIKRLEERWQQRRIQQRQTSRQTRSISSQPGRLQRHWPQGRQSLPDCKANDEGEPGCHGRKVCEERRGRAGSNTWSQESSMETTLRGTTQRWIPMEPWGTLRNPLPKSQHCWSPQAWLKKQSIRRN